ncbi:MULTISPECIES: LysE family translocator [unclassified Natrinema]|uniref:LysE family translocator n=1 Tax=unclassified Natrinema TaxID=2622230 RepID=UPI001E5683B4|nr:LysE family translocator [Natrinema sp. J7-1]
MSLSPIVHTIAAVPGLAAVLRTSVLAYMGVKYVGAASLLYLGVQTFWSDDQFDLQTDLAKRDDSLVETYRKAVMINVSNPKVAVFVLAFFPQFVPETTNAAFQLSILESLYAGLSVLYLGIVALFATRLRHRLLRSAVTRRAVQYVSGSVPVGFGLPLAVEKRPAA